MGFLDVFKKKDTESEPQGCGYSMLVIQDKKPTKMFPKFTSLQGYLAFDEKHPMDQRLNIPKDVLNILIELDRLGFAFSHIGRNGITFECGQKFRFLEREPKDICDAERFK